MGDEIRRKVRGNHHVGRALCICGTGERSVNASSRDRQNARATLVQRAERNTSSSGLYWQGRRAFRVGDPGQGEPPALAFCWSKSSVPSRTYAEQGGTTR
jgi:hypothetical protein